MLMEKRIISGCCWVAVLFLGACRHEEILLNKPNENVRSLGAYLANSTDYSLFVAGLEYTGLMDTLRNVAGQYTVLAPANDAFRALGVNTPADVQKLNRDSLRFALAYHILPFRLMLDDIPINQIDLRFETLSGISLYAHRYLFRNDYGNISGQTSNVRCMMATFSGAEVANAVSLNNLTASTDNIGDIVLANGVLHSLTKVMKVYPEHSVQRWLETHPDYTVFVAGLKRFNLWNELAGQGPFTVFAPPNRVFAEWGISEQTVSTWDVNQYIGPRLFGAYIMYNKHYFVKDYHFFVATQGQYWLAEPLRDDSTYNRMFMGQSEFTHLYVGGAGGILYQSGFGHRFHPTIKNFFLYDYSLGISKDMTPYNYFTPNAIEDRNRFLGGGVNPELYICSGRLKERNDHLCANGLVHTLDHLLVHPTEALYANE